MAKTPNIRENTFDGAPGGSAGILNYQTPYGTPKGGKVVQDPRHFAGSGKDTKHFQPNTSMGSSSPEAPTNEPEDKPVAAVDQTTSPMAQAEKMKSEMPLDPTQNLDPQVDKVFQKKDTPSPDEVMSALQYEINNMTKKDKHIAKQLVLNNLKEDPHYYSRLNMLNVNDNEMKVDESTVSKTKAVLDEMIKEKQQSKNPVATSPEISKIFKDLLDKRKSYRR